MIPDFSLYTLGLKTLLLFQSVILFAFIFMQLLFFGVTNVRDSGSVLMQDLRAFRNLSVFDIPRMFSGFASVVNLLCLLVNIFCEGGNRVLSMYLPLVSENNFDHPHPRISEKYVPKICHNMRGRMA